MKCFWCRKETSKRWIPYVFSAGQSVYFCSKKCLAAATVNGKGKCVDINKIAAKQRRVNQKEKSCKTQELMQKEKLSNGDLAQLFYCLSAKRKNFLALVGLANMSRAARGNPKQLLEKIDKGVSELKTV